MLQHINAKDPKRFNIPNAVSAAQLTAFTHLTERFPQLLLLFFFFKNLTSPKVYFCEIILKLTEKYMLLSF